jgi:CO/xanthine dehydrogenase FAD-binding subunit
MSIEVTEAGDLVLDAVLTAGALALAPEVQRGFLALAEAAALSYGSLAQVIAQPDNRSDVLPALVVLGAWVQLGGPSGRREVPLEYLHTGPQGTAPQPGEQVLQVRVPRLPHRGGGAFIAAGEAGAAAVVVFAEDGSTLTQVRLSLTGQIGRQSRARAAEAVLEGHMPDDQRVAAAAQAAKADVAPAGVLANPDATPHCVREALERAIERARQGLDDAGA